MKQLLSGATLAAALAIAAPVWAQTGTPMSPSSRNAPPSASTEAPSEAMPSHRMRSHKMIHHKTMRHGMSRGASSSDNVANQLNAQEAAKSGGSTPPASAPGMMGSYPSPYGQPNPEQGIPGAAEQSPASSHYPSGPGPAYVPGQYQSSPRPNAPSR